MPETASAAATPAPAASPTLPAGTPPPRPTTPPAQTGRARGGKGASRGTVATATVSAAAHAATPAPAAKKDAAPASAAAPGATTEKPKDAPAAAARPTPAPKPDDTSLARPPAPGKSKSLEAIKAERRARTESQTATAAPAEGTAAAAAAAAPAAATTATDSPAPGATTAAAAKPADNKKPDAAVATTAAEPPKPTADVIPTDISDAALAQFTKLNRDLRTATTRIKELETAAGASSPLLSKVQTAEKLAKEGKHYDAIKALGIVDFDKAAAEVMGQATAEAELDPKVKEIRDAANAEIQALKDKLAALEEGQTKTKEEREAEKKEADAERKRLDARAKEEGTTRIVAEVTALADRFPFLSKSPDFVREALNGADEAYPLLVKKLGRDLNDDERNGLLRAALEEAETQHAGRAKLYATATDRYKKPEEPPAPAPSPTVTSDVRGNVVSHKPRVKKTFEQVKAERRKAN